MDRYASQVRAAALVALGLALASVLVSSRPPPRAPPGPPNAGLRAGQPLAVQLLVGRRLDLNRATEADLAALPGIGRKRARRIVRFREWHGRFHTLGELAQVPGIGPRTVERLRPLVAPGPAPPP